MTASALIRQAWESVPKDDPCREHLLKCLWVGTGIFRLRTAASPDEPVPHYTTGCMACGGTHVLDYRRIRGHPLYTHEAACPDTGGPTFVMTDPDYCPPDHA